MVSALSSYVSYLNVNRDLKTSLSKVSEQSVVKRETDYYEANIDNVKTVDEFLDNYRLYSYAMKAYGLEEMTFGKGFMRKVLESDLNDQTSFANTLADKRYLQFAQAFNFAGDTKVAQNTAQADKLAEAYQASFPAEESRIKQESAYFSSQIGSVTNVDDLVNNAKLRTYMLNAAGLDPTFTSRDYLKQVLTSDLNDPNSVANKASNTAWKQLTRAFNFNADGTINGQVQTADQTEDLKLDYVAKMSTFQSNTLLSANQRYWEKHISQVTSAQDLVKDSRLLSYVKTAFSLPTSIQASSVASLMSSESFATVYGNTKLLSFFNFENDGSVMPGKTPQTTDQVSKLATQYSDVFVKERSASIDKAAANYESRIAKVTKLDDFFVSNKKDDDANNDQVTEIWNVALRAYGIDPDEVSTTKLKRILTSDTDNKKSYVNTLKDDRFVQLAKAFNFSSDGTTESPLTAQSQSMVQQLTTEYKTTKLRSLTGAALTTATKAADKEIDYYKTKMMEITSSDQLIADTRLTSFIFEANGIDPKSVNASDLRRMFKSDLSDPKSFVNLQSDSKFAQIVASFNFNTQGKLDPTAKKGIQQRGAILDTTTQYVRQTLEEQQGDQNAAVRLALYFKRKAPDITSAYTILADKALFEFFKTTFSLPAAIGNMDVDKQVAVVKKFMDVTKLNDTTYVDGLVKRFTALYDAQNQSTTDTSLLILGR
ncbi:hypothetical protein QE369_004450 [Agrobacterium larrymoorei]|uniref:DUF1217 domain-containing protein n=1 Tax=Agrobacterium larrymoorei TaxID=160699 RepID=A0AAJ2BIA4_9HYPH|nr:DUF1217 domain-containing protein [Agrobacterium larrymoorei]MDR6104253.1 hypothetical protein [Agrobacterium larrymoorei]